MSEVRMSLKEAARRLGIKENSVRSRFKAGKIRGERDNSGKIWVYINPDETPGNQRSKPDISKPTIEGFEAFESQHIKALQDHVQTLAKELEAARTELAEIRPQANEADRLKTEINGARELLTMQKAMQAVTEQQRDEYRQQAQETLGRLLKISEQSETRRSLWERLFSRRNAA